MFMKYGDFVKPSFTYENDKGSAINSKCLSGDEARRIYLNEVNSLTQYKVNIESNESLSKTDAPKSSPSRQVDNVEILDKDLLLAVQNDDITTLKRALDNCPDKINYIDDFGWSLLMIACQANNVEIVKELLQRCADTSIRDKAGNSAQSLIIKNKNYKLAELFLNNTQNDVKNVNKNRGKSKKDLDSYSCDICNINVPVSKSVHLSSTIHNINLSKGKRIPTNYAIPQTNKGYQMMIKVGWDKESGLGRDGSGKKYPIKAIQKKDRKGLGHSKKPLEITEKLESIKFKNKRGMARDNDNNKKLEVHFRRQFY